MRFALFVLLAAIAPACAKTIVVKVGRDAKNTIASVYTPSAIKADVGDIVRFEFRGGNHTVTQSSFNEPCTQQLNTVTKKAGVNSGFIPYDEKNKKIGTYAIQIKQSQTPIWMFCNRKPHCNAGMVFSINAPTDPTKNTMAKFVAKAKTANHPGPGVTANFTPPPTASSAVPPASSSLSSTLTSASTSSTGTPGNLAPAPTDPPLTSGASRLVGGSAAGVLFTATAALFMGFLV